MKTFAELGTEIGELVERKNAAYGSSFAVAGEFLALLYPNGLRSAQYADALLLVRIFDKQMRIATDRDALGESPYADISGYGILGAHMHQERKASTECSNVNGPVAPSSSSPNPSATAETSTGAKPSPNASARPTASSLPEPSKSASKITSAPTPTATEAASPNAEDRHSQAIANLASHLLRLMRRCNDFQLCAICGNIINGGALRTTVWTETFIICRGCDATVWLWQDQLLQSTMRLKGGTQ